MKPNIKLLEERIQDVVERLTELREERNRLRDELESARADLETFETEGAVPGWTGSLVEVRQALREAVDELRAD